MPALRDCTLYAILDLGYVKPDALETTARLLVEGGVDLLQLRAKKFGPREIEQMARRILPVTRHAGVPLVINDHPAVAAATGCEGVHIGQDDMGVAEARRLAGHACFVGKSTHSVDQARAALAEGADYLGYGPLYATGTKPDYAPIGLGGIADVERLASVPVFVIGGVNLDRLPQVLAAGARRVVVVSAFLQASDIRAAVGEVRQLLQQKAQGLAP